MLRRFLIGTAVLLAAIIFATKLVEWWTEAWWFEEIGYLSVYHKIFLSRLAMFILGAAVFGGIVGIHARRAWYVVAQQMAAPRDIIAEVSAIAEPDQKQYFVRYHRWFWGFGVVLPTLLAGQLMASRWMLWHHFANAIASGIKEPLHNRDLSFYLLQLPALNLVWSFIFSTLLWALALTLFIYGFEGMIRLERSPETKPHRPTPLPVIRHLALLIALLLLWKAIGYQLSPYNLLPAQHGNFTGPGYTDVHWRLPLFSLLFFLTLSLSLATFWFGERANAKQMQRVWWPLQSYVALSIIMGAVIPWLVQRFIVEPDEPAREQPHIAQHIEWTRRSYGLDNIRREHTGVLQANVEAAASHLPAWPPDALLSYLNQHHNSHSGFQYRNITLANYRVDNETRSVFVAARELVLETLPNPDWRSTHLLHTSGNGLVIVDAQRTDPRGQPLVYSGNALTQNTDLASPRIKQPLLFFGEFPRLPQRAPLIPRTRTISSPPNSAPPGSTTAGPQLPGQAPAVPSPVLATPATWAPTPAFVVLNSRNALHKYSGKGGIAIRSFWRKWLLAWRFIDLRLALSSEVQENSRIVWNRRVIERCRELAPFISFDAAEPRPIVTDDGRIIWLLDGFTLSNSYPYAAPIEDSTGVNYVRNSVKATVDAYDGTVRFYVADASDPIMRSNRVIFPKLFSPLEEMPADIRRHLRHPVALLAAQARIWGRYHHATSAQWLSAENVWIPLNSRTTVQQPVLAPSLFIAPYLWLPEDSQMSNRSTQSRSLLTSISVLSPQQPLSNSFGLTTQTQKLASILLAAPGEPLREWRPETPLSLPSTDQTVPDVGIQTAPFSTTNIALVPHENALLYFTARLKNAEQGEFALTEQWGVLQTNRYQTFASRADAVQVIIKGLSVNKNVKVPTRTMSPTTSKNAVHSADLEQLSNHFRSMQNARRTGDWKAYGESEKNIERLLERYNK